MAMKDVTMIALWPRNAGELQLALNSFLICFLMFYFHYFDNWLQFTNTEIIVMEAIDVSVTAMEIKAMNMSDVADAQDRVYRWITASQADGCTTCKSQKISYWVILCQMRTWFDCSTIQISNLSPTEYRDGLALMTKHDSTWLDWMLPFCPFQLKNNLFRFNYFIAIIYMILIYLYASASI